MDRHVQTLSTLNVIYGALGFLVSLGVFLQHGSLHNIHEAFNEDIYGLLAVVFVLYHLAVGIPCMAAGWFVRQYHDPARVALIVISALNMLAVPVGTAIGAYGLWVLMSPESDPLFEPRNEPARKPAGRKAGASPSAAIEPNKRPSTSILPSPE